MEQNIVTTEELTEGTELMSEAITDSKSFKVGKFTLIGVGAVVVAVIAYGVKKFIDKKKAVKENNETIQEDSKDPVEVVEEATAEE